MYILNDKKIRLNLLSLCLLLIVFIDAVYYLPNDLSLTFKYLFIKTVIKTIL